MHPDVLQYHNTSLIVLLAVSPLLVMAQDTEKEDKNPVPETQANAYTSAKGQYPGGPGDAFTYVNAEASSVSNYNGVYYADGASMPTLCMRWGLPVYTPACILVCSGSTSR